MVAAWGTGLAGAGAGFWVAGFWVAGFCVEGRAGWAACPRPAGRCDVCAPSEGTQKVAATAATRTKTRMLGREGVAIMPLDAPSDRRSAQGPVRPVMFAAGRPVVLADTRGIPEKRIAAG